MPAKRLRTADNRAIGNAFAHLDALLEVSANSQFNGAADVLATVDRADRRVGVQRGGLGRVRLAVYDQPVLFRNLTDVAFAGCRRRVSQDAQRSHRLPTL
jgi:hypothetical protein